MGWVVFDFPVEADGKRPVWFIHRSADRSQGLSDCRLNAIHKVPNDATVVWLAHPSHSPNYAELEQKQVAEKVLRH